MRVSTPHKTRLHRTNCARTHHVIFPRRLQLQCQHICWAIRPKKRMLTQQSVRARLWSAHKHDYMGMSDTLWGVSGFCGECSWWSGLKVYTGHHMASSCTAYGKWVWRCVNECAGYKYVYYGRRWIGSNVVRIEYMSHRASKRVEPGGIQIVTNIEDVFD